MERSIPLAFENKTINYKVALEVGKHLSKTTVKIALIGAIALQINTQIESFKQKLPLPMKVESQELKELQRIKKALVALNCPKEKIEIIADAISKGAKVANVDPILIAVLMNTESEFKVTAKSNKGYKGLMQTPTSTKIEVVDTVHGCAKLKEKLQDNKGDILAALTNYKGSAYKNGKSSVGLKQAKEVIAKYHQIKRTIGA